MADMKFVMNYNIVQLVKLDLYTHLSIFTLFLNAFTVFSPGFRLKRSFSLVSLEVVLFYEISKNGNGRTDNISENFDHYLAWLRVGRVDNKIPIKIKSSANFIFIKFFTNWYQWSYEQ